MIEQLQTIQKNYEELLEATKKEKQSIKRNIPKLEKLKGQNAELGIDTVQLDVKIEEETENLEKYNKDIVKYKKVIHRLGVCMDIMQDEEYSDIEEVEPLESDTPTPEEGEE